MIERLHPLFVERIILVIVLAGVFILARRRR